MTQKILCILFMGMAFFVWNCQSNPIIVHGKHYRENKDYQSLRKVVDLMQLGVDSSYVRTILGEPIDFGFDFRYLIDSSGAGGCVIGAVFHLDSEGKIDDKWLDEICE